jgi:L,D-transpeptidase ErfK/SrfK
MVRDSVIAAGAARVLLLGAVLAGGSVLSGRTPPPDPSPDGVLVGGEFSYTVKKGDSLASVGARLGVGSRTLARSNRLAPSARLRIGQILHVDNRHIVPFPLDDGILVNIPQRLLFLFQEGRLSAWYPVGLGRLEWPTPAGRSQVASLERHPTWHVPPSIQEEMSRRGKRVATRVAPGPTNPLGDYWIGLEGSGCGIHGTNAPASVYGFRTHGCVRLHPDDITDLFPRVSMGMAVRLVYEPILLARAADGAVFLEVNPDVYGRKGDPAAEVTALAQRQDLQSDLSPAAVERVIAEKEGLARRVDVPVAPTPERTRSSR